MGVNALWQLLRDEEVVEHYKGALPQDYAAIVAAVDGKAIAVDLSMWIMQARGWVEWLAASSFPRYDEAVPRLAGVRANILATNRFVAAVC